MSNIAFLESSQRMIIVATTFWILWAILGGIDAPHNPSNFLMVIFCMTVVMAYFMSMWIVSPFISGTMPLLLRFPMLVAFALAPLTIMLIVGHFIAIGTITLLS